MGKYYDEDDAEKLKKQEQGQTRAEKGYSGGGKGSTVWPERTSPTKTTRYVRGEPLAPVDDDFYEEARPEIPLDKLKPGEYVVAPQGGHYRLPRKGETVYVWEPEPAHAGGCLLLDMAIMFGVVAVVVILLLLAVHVMSGG
jgi:hypothetical protein